MTGVRSKKAAEKQEAVGQPADPMSVMSELLMSQALTLDGMFAELVENAANSKPYPMTLDRYTRLALRAQGNCRSALMGMVRAERELRQAHDAAE